MFLCTQIVFPKSDEQRARLAASVKNILLFRALEKVIKVKLKGEKQC